MTHWRQSRDPALAALKRRDARFDRAFKLALFGVICITLLAWRFALS